MAEPASAQVKSGETVTVACNLPHGLTIEHKGKRVTLAGANHPKALSTDTTLSGTWGLTPNVDKAWFDDWARESKHSAVANGNIFAAQANKAPDMAEEFADAIPTGTDPIDPAKPGNGVEPVAGED